MSASTSVPISAAPALLVRDLQPADIDALLPVLREHVRDLHSGVVVESEVAAITGYMRNAADAAGRRRRYLVACDASNPEQALACMAWAAPDAQMQRHFEQTGLTDGNAVELLNAFVARARLGGQGVGRTLFAAVCRQAAAEGATGLLVNSGPRYRANWGFYDRVCDSSHGMLVDYYGPGRHAKTWYKALAPANADLMPKL